MLLKVNCSYYTLSFHSVLGSSMVYLYIIFMLSKSTVGIGHASGVHTVCSMSLKYTTNSPLLTQICGKNLRNRKVISWCYFSGNRSTSNAPGVTKRKKEKDEKFGTARKSLLAGLYERVILYQFYLEKKPFHCQTV